MCLYKNDLVEHAYTLYDRLCKKQNELNSLEKEVVNLKEEKVKGVNVLEEQVSQLKQNISRKKMTYTSSIICELSTIEASIKKLKKHFQDEDMQAKHREK